MKSFTGSGRKSRTVRSLLFLLFGFVPALQATQVVGKPEISRSGSAATVRWQTDVPCGTSAKVEPPARVTEPADRSPTTEHQVTVSDLRPNVPYQISLGTARKWLTAEKLSANGDAPIPAPTPAQKTAPTTSGRQSWGNPASLPDHFARHGRDFGATSPEDYAQKALEFLQQAKQEGFPAKLDVDGTLRVFDPKSGAFAAYNRNGTTKTFFKPGRSGYFERQPGKSIDLGKQS